MLTSAFDVPSIQWALDHVEHGDKIYIPSGTYTAPASGWVIRKSVEIYGDGAGSASGGGAILKPNAGHVFVIDPPVGTTLTNINLHDLRISGKVGSSGTSGLDGIHHNTANNKKLAGIRIERVVIEYMGQVGINLVGTLQAAGNVTAVHIADCDVSFCAKQGVLLGFVFQGSLLHTRLAKNKEEGLKATDSGVTLYVCGLDGSQRVAGEAELLLDSCNLARIDACAFEDFGGIAVLLRRCGGVGQVSAGRFKRDSFSVGAIGIEVPGSPNGAILVLPNRFIGIGKGVEVQAGAIGTVVFPQFFDPLTAGGTPINLLPDADDALLAVPSAMRPSGNLLSGLLLPSMTADPTSNVQKGMLFYHGDAHAMKVWDGTGWKKFALVAPPDPVSNLAIDSVVGRTSLAARWTAPMDKGWSDGKVLSYDVRYSLALINEANFAMATQGPTVTPGSPGSQQCALFQSLASGTTYYVAVKSVDHSGNTAAISNVPSAQTLSSGTTEASCT